MTYIKKKKLLSKDSQSLNDDDDDFFHFQYIEKNLIKENPILF